MPASTARNNIAYNEPNDRQAGTLVMTERWWRDRYNVISERGYRLRPRYHPQWEPSWSKTGKDFYTVEDGQATILRATMDANRIRDGRPVMLKKVLPGDGPHELRINQLFSSAEHSRERDNHCAPLLDVIELSGQFGSQRLMVFPLLRPFNQPRIQTFGEFAAFFTQICEGIRFMHQRNVAHRDCTANNIMFDSSKMYPNGFHPVKIDRNRNFKGTAKAYTRTQRPPRYYFIDFGLSRQYPSQDATDEPLRGGDKSAPEHRSGRRCNPFHTDIYYIGNLIRQEFVMKCNGFEFMEDLIASMTRDNPAERPPIEEVLQEFSRIRASLKKRKLRSAIESKNAPKVLGIIRQARQSIRTLGYVVSGRPAIPDPNI
ncbi:kinase-like domain-containing protein [Lactarius psammicola]|nr:kinase-like domain-containing protein [Lactarius psammicola]